MREVHKHSFLKQPSDRGRTQEDTQGNMGFTRPNGSTENQNMSESLRSLFRTLG
ncbi:hypothetical protein DPMN_167386 [Dreissena polymorpha]|uniref:Uncharacterized protein n=1 Tax=Dreissena polymorpha TaxID=45954 RepID=A0A9D4F0Q0_DREPO|nr:hypothetical protein DPMN_167386 [Dreissena polymorpha]